MGGVVPIYERHRATSHHPPLSWTVSVCLNMEYYRWLRGVILKCKVDLMITESPGTVFKISSEYFPLLSYMSVRKNSHHTHTHARAYTHTKSKP